MTPPTNNDLTPHTDNNLPHTDNDLTPHTDNNLTPHTDKDLTPHTDNNLTPHTDKDLTPHTNNDLPHTENNLTPRTNHTNNNLTPHTDNDLPHTDNNLTPHTNHTNNNLTPHTNNDLTPHTENDLSPHTDNDLTPHTDNDLTPPTDNSAHVTTLRRNMPTPKTPVEEAALKLFTVVERKKEYEMLAHEHAQRCQKLKTKQEQYLEQTSRALNCTALTKSIDIEYLTKGPKGEIITIEGSAMRKRDGWFRVSLVNYTEFLVQEADLYNVEKYRVKEANMFVSARDRDVNNRRVKRESKRREEEKMLTRKKEAAQARKKMLDDEMDRIEKCVADGEFSRELLIHLLQKATTPFEHRQGDYVTVANGGNDATCASVIAMSALDGVLSAKRKADEMSCLEAKRRANTGKKIKRTPNTTRGDDGISTVFRLEQFDERQAKTDSVKVMKKKQQQVESITKELTEWSKLVQKKTTLAATKNLGVADPSLWMICAPKMHTQKERQLFLRLCVPSSGALGKKEEEQLAILRDNDVTYLKLLAAVESAQKRLTALEKDFRDSFSSESSVEQQSSTVPETNGEDYYEQEDHNNDDLELL